MEVLISFVKQHEDLDLLLKHNILRSKNLQPAYSVVILNPHALK